MLHRLCLIPPGALPHAALSPGLCYGLCPARKEGRWAEGPPHPCIQAHAVCGPDCVRTMASGRLAWALTMTVTRCLPSAPGARSWALLCTGSCSHDADGIGGATAHPWKPHARPGSVHTRTCEMPCRSTDPRSLVILNTEHVGPCLVLLCGPRGRGGQVGFGGGTGGPRGRGG